MDAFDLDIIPKRWHCKYYAEEAGAQQEVEPVAVHLAQQPCRPRRPLQGWENRKKCQEIANEIVDLTHLLGDPLFQNLHQALLAMKNAVLEGQEMFILTRATTDQANLQTAARPEDPGHSLDPVALDNATLKFPAPSFQPDPTEVNLDHSSQEPGHSSDSVALDNATLEFPAPSFRPAPTEVNLNHSSQEPGHSSDPVALDNATLEFPAPSFRPAPGHSSDSADLTLDLDPTQDLLKLKGIIKPPKPLKSRGRPAGALLTAIGTWRKRANLKTTQRKTNPKRKEKIWSNPRFARNDYQCCPRTKTGAAHVLYRISSSSRSHHSPCGWLSNCIPVTASGSTGSAAA
ncbi:hypothetical protein CAPTEDRAFT_201710 [Capitella teleta]|uniref:Uncharacterized protein n=1 Tax=Capitella teleta TaxID=283909 RepID=R7TW91_CAPTE|nr:hypothetical protein CAPTEDRAFT_201710 [Capitella teleta]|eukprot:ELT95716.1 hypothetical protein CAPTEDRAFT_201710 [Capitella teleta]